MYQRLPKFPHNPPEDALSHSAQRQPQPAPRRVLLTLLICFALAWSGSNLPVFHGKGPQRHAPITLGKIQIDPDGDDPRMELLYHWQDPRFSDEEHRQIGWMADGLALFAIIALVKKTVKEARR